MGDNIYEDGAASKAADFHSSDTALLTFNKPGGHLAPESKTCSEDGIIPRGVLGTTWGAQPQERTKSGSKDLVTNLIAATPGTSLALDLPHSFQGPTGRCELNVASVDRMTERWSGTATQEKSGSKSTAPLAAFGVIDNFETVSSLESNLLRAHHDPAINYRGQVATLIEAVDQWSHVASQEKSDVGHRDLVGAFAARHVADNESSLEPDRPLHGPTVNEPHQAQSLDGATDDWSHIAALGKGDIEPDPSKHYSSESTQYQLQLWVYETSNEKLTVTERLVKAKWETGCGMDG